MYENDAKADSEQHHIVGHLRPWLYAFIHS